MKIIGFFNNKGGVGKTSLVYHVAWMLSLMNHRVIAVDLDPQANLTSMFLSEERLEEIWDKPDHEITIYDVISPQFRGTGDIRPPHVQMVFDPIDPISESIGLLIGDLKLSLIEDTLSDAWPRCQNREERAFRVMSAFARTIAAAGHAHHAEIAVVDVGPNLGALNRAALLACDYVVVPLGADLFSLQGLRNMGPTMRDWRNTWGEAQTKNPDKNLVLPEGRMLPIGYVVMRFSTTESRPARAYAKWITRMPKQYREFILDEKDAPESDPESDPNRLATLKDYRSLMPMAQEARKPMFRLRPADGAFGGHQQAVTGCYDDFQSLTRKILERSGGDEG
ncbi:ParA family protein [Acidibrevibacterium fodinaquatile]|uniref:ParA family protein n=1 Tax=Acidibrevibacterium fodinaquatile TaxID=1969806 RepID=UPI000E0D95DA|nr:ParA family protein [Acidibrevibacterium fodinaquatile]